jgi:phospholipid/cholesterol/gamma-HCH transport system ATP-binding protein
VTHELPSAFLIADRMCVMQGGEIVAVGTPDDVRNHPDPRVQQFMNRVPEDENRDVQQYLRNLTE